MANVMSVSFVAAEISRELTDERTDKCEHVEAGVAPHALCKEDDSFGPVGRTILCKACYEKDRDAEKERLCFCNDCKKEIRRWDLRGWRWYDFYAAQGDEELLLCAECWEAPRHKERMRQDKEDEEAEFPSRPSGPIEPAIEDPYEEDF